MNQRYSRQTSRFRDPLFCQISRSVQKLRLDEWGNCPEQKINRGCIVAPPPHPFSAWVCQEVQWVQRSIPILLRALQHLPFFRRDPESLARATATFWVWERCSLFSCPWPQELFAVIMVLLRVPPSRTMCKMAAQGAEIRYNYPLPSMSSTQVYRSVYLMLHCGWAADLEVPSLNLASAMSSLCGVRQATLHQPQHHICNWGIIILI